MPEFFKVYKYSPIGLKPCTSDRSNQLSLIKNACLELPGPIIVVLQSLKNFTYLAFKGFSVLNLSIWQFTILHRNHLKLFTDHQITAF